MRAVLWGKWLNPGGSKRAADTVLALISASSWGLSAFTRRFFTVSHLLCAWSNITSHIHLNLLLLLGKIKLSHQTQMASNPLALLFCSPHLFLFISSSSIRLLWPPPGRGMLVSLPCPYCWVFECSGSERTTEASEWWMADPWVLSFPFPDRSTLIAFVGLSFAGNGLKHDMSLTQCLSGEKEGVP